jgi:hypothetical protein
VLAARLLPELSKLHFKKGGTKLRFEFKEIDGVPNATVSVELDNAEEALDCVKDIKSRMEVITLVYTTILLFSYSLSITITLNPLTCVFGIFQNRQKE